MKKVIFLLLGVGIGGAIATYICKRKFEAELEKEIDSVKEAFGRRYKPVKKDNGDTSKHPAPGVKDDKVVNAKEVYKETMQKIGYDTYSSDKKPQTEETEEPEIDEPYPGSDLKAKPTVITPDEFEETNIHFDKNTFYYYKGDKTMVDDTGMEIDDDLTAAVGTDFLNHVGEYEENTVYIRNARLQADYQIIVEEDAYHD